MLSRIRIFDVCLKCVDVRMLLVDDCRTIKRAYLYQSTFLAYDITNLGTPS